MMNLPRFTVKAGDGLAFLLMADPVEWYKLMTPFLVMTACDRAVEESLETINRHTVSIWPSDRFYYAPKKN